MSLDRLRNEYEGERIVLVGNGPSLTDTPLSRIGSTHSLAMNKINHIYGETDWRPSFYYFTQPNADGKEKRFIREHIDMGITCFIKETHRGTFGNHGNVHYVGTRELKAEPLDATEGLHATDIEAVVDLPLDRLSDFWSSDPSDVVYTYHSMYGVFQLVAYLGFDEVYLVGCDLGYDVHDPHLLFDDGLDPLEYGADEKRDFLREAHRKGVLVETILNGLAYVFFDTPIARAYNRVTDSLPGAGDPNHFHDSYRAKPKDNTYANREITKSHLVANRILADDGVDVYNATIGGDLEVYPRVDFEEVV